MIGKYVDGERFVDVRAVPTAAQAFRNGLGDAWLLGNVQDFDGLALTVVDITSLLGLTWRNGRCKALGVLLLLRFWWLLFLLAFGVLLIIPLYILTTFRNLLLLFRSL